jgi:Na+-transporting NADH:ubiquinone oxidoreductase subunit A
MKLRGGYNVPLSGKPGAEVQVLPDPDALHLPLAGRRLRFTEVRVRDGQAVRPGEILAVDPERYHVPLLAPRAGKVAVTKKALILSGLSQEQEEPYKGEELNHAASAGTTEAVRQKLVDLGAWQFVSDAFTCGLPDPAGVPQAIVVTTMSFEPFTARGDVQMAKRLTSFTRGLEHMQGLLEYQPIYLAIPAVQNELAEKVRQTVRGYAYVKVVTIPRKYPFDHPALIARRLGLRSAGGSIWSLGVAGVLAVDRAMSASLPSTVRIVAVGGPGVSKPTHVKVCAGYPIRKILDACGAAENVRVIMGGALTGAAWSPEDQPGLCSECTSLTVLRDEAPRSLLGWARPGWSQQSFSPYYVSKLRPAFKEPLNTALRGERRACVSCQLCEKACPAGIWPHLIHKHLFQDNLEQAEAARLDLCVECGLCSYVCPSKLELLDQFRAAKKAIADMAAEEAEEMREKAEKEARE